MKKPKIEVKEKKRQVYNSFDSFKKDHIKDEPNMQSGGQRTIIREYRGPSNHRQVMMIIWIALIAFSWWLSAISGAITTTMFIVFNFYYIKAHLKLFYRKHIKKEMVRLKE